MNLMNGTNIPCTTIQTHTIREHVLKIGRLYFSHTITEHFASVLFECSSS